MIARGDLAVEIGFERLAEMQEEILWLAEAAHVPVIWATQVLESLVKQGLPSRGEMTDAAMAARAECVMLNKGPFVAEAVRALDRLLGRMGEHQNKKTPRLRALRSWWPLARWTARRRSRRWGDESGQGAATQAALDPDPLAPSPRGHGPSVRQQDGNRRVRQHMPRRPAQDELA